MVRSLAPLTAGPYRTFFLGRTISVAGSTVSPIALAFAVLDLGGSATQLGWVLAAGMAPQLVLGLVGGVVADRARRRTVMVVSNLLAAVSQGGAAAALVLGVASVWTLVLATAVTGTATAFFQPAAQGIVPELVAHQHLQRANALLRLANNLLKGVGPAIGGLVVATAGSAVVIGWDAATFLVAAVVLGRLAVPDGGARPRVAFRSDLAAGWRAFARRTWLWVLVLQGAVAVVPWLVGYQMLGPDYGRTHLGGAAAWGLAMSAFAVGLVAGSVIGLALPLRRTGMLVCLATGAMAVPLAAMSAGLGLPWLMAALAVTGVGLDVSIVAWFTTLHAHVPADLQGRVNSCNTLGQLALVPLGYLLAGPIVQRVGLTDALGGAAALIFLAAVVPLAVPSVRRLSTSVPTTPSVPAQVDHRQPPYCVEPDVSPGVSRNKTAGGDRLRGREALSR